MIWKVVGGVLGATLPIPIFLALPFLDHMAGWILAIGLQIPILGAWGGVNVGAQSRLAVGSGLLGYVLAFAGAAYLATYPSYAFAGILRTGLAAGTANLFSRWKSRVLRG